MEGSDNSLVPQWLKSSGNVSRVAGLNNQFTSSPYSDHITYSGRQWSPSSKGPGLSRSYSSSERSWHERHWEKDIDNDGLTPVSHDIPMTVGSSNKAMNPMMMHQSNVSTSTSSITLGTTGLSMAETLAQGPPRSYSPPQLSATTQKLEELALKQSRLLIPVTPSPRSLVANSSEKSKVKTGQQQYPFSSRRPSHSLHGAHPNLDVQKINSGNSHSVCASRELSGVSSAAKDNLSPNSRVVLSPIGATRSTSISAPSRTRSSGNNSTPSTWITLEKKPTFPTQSRNDFFKNLSRKSSLEKPCSDVLPIDMTCAFEKSEASITNVMSCPILKSRDPSSADASDVNMLTEYSSKIIENGIAANEPLKPSTIGDKQHSSNSLPYPDEEEISFLRSLGWEESAGDDEGLTEEEIQDFYEKCMKLKL